MGSPVMSSDPYSGAVYDGGVIYGGNSAADLPPTMTPLQTVPMESGRLPKAHLSNAALLGVPMFSHVVGDRKLLPNESLESLNRDMVLPIESAAARESGETK